MVGSCLSCPRRPYSRLGTYGGFGEHCSTCSFFSSLGFSTYYPHTSFSPATPTASTKEGTFWSTRARVEPDGKWEWRPSNSLNNHELPIRQAAPPSLGRSPELMVSS